jgi:hypothetical protein
MRCLSDAELQAFADGELPEPLAAHIPQCSACSAGVERLRRDSARLAAAINGAADLSLPARARIRGAINSSRSSRGATALRPWPSGRAWRQRALVSACATAAVVALVVFGVLPRVDAPTTLSASEVLSRSLQTLSRANGIEFLEYRLDVDGVAQGAWRIEQLIDHARPTRYRIALYTTDGVLQSALSQNPQRGQRSQLVRIDDRNYIVDIEPVAREVLSLPQMGQALIEAAITMMQASANQHFTVQEHRYVIEIPPVTPLNAAATLDLHRARTVVNSADFRIEEFEAAGALLKQPFSVSFKLLRQEIWGSEGVPDSAFDIPRGTNDVVLQGEEADEPMRELLTTLVRQLSGGKAR